MKASTVVDDPRQIASADDLRRRFGDDAPVIARALCGHRDPDVREYWLGVLDLLGERASA